MHIRYLIRHVGRLYPLTECIDVRVNPCWSDYVCTTFCEVLKKNETHRCGSRIWSGGGPSKFFPIFADGAQGWSASEASIYRPGSRARLRALEALVFLSVKYANPLFQAPVLQNCQLIIQTGTLTKYVWDSHFLENVQDQKCCKGESCGKPATCSRGPGPTLGPSKL